MRRQRSQRGIVESAGREGTKARRGRYGEQVRERRPRVASGIRGGVCGGEKGRPAGERITRVVRLRRQTGKGRAGSQRPWTSRCTTFSDRQRFPFVLGANEAPTPHRPTQLTNRISRLAIVQRRGSSRIPQTTALTNLEMAWSLQKSERQRQTGAGTVVDEEVSVFQG